VKEIEDLLKDLSQKAEHCGSLLWIRSADEQDTEQTGKRVDRFDVEASQPIRKSINCSEEELVKAFFYLGVAKPLPSGMLRSFLNGTLAKTSNPLSNQLTFIVSKQQEVNVAVSKILSAGSNCSKLRDALRHYLGRKVPNENIKEFGPAELQLEYCIDILANFLPTSKRPSFGWLVATEESANQTLEHSLVVEQALRAA
jgi:hypothetical protein